jgi:HAD superfamily hydrolase (TIGR01458 family)
MYVGERAIDGAREAVSQLKRSGLPVRFVTNTTTRSRAMLHDRVAKLDLPIEPHEIINAPRAAASHLRSIGKPRCRFVVSPDVLEEFEGIERDDVNPEAIVIGDIGNRWDYDLMSELFASLVKGARLIALHKGRYYQGPDGLILDIGAFVTGLEYASGVTATVIGKPAAAFFHAAAADMGIAPDRAAMVGDDIESDVGGAQRAGLAGILVKTGKFRSHLASASSVRPDAVVPSIADLPNLMGV